MTEGLRDAYSIARHDRKELYTLRYRKPERLVPRRRRRTRSSSGCAGTGRSRRRSYPAASSLCSPRIRDEGVEAVAVCLIHSYVNPEHELQVRDLLRAEFPELSITLSHEIAREWREYERASSAVLNAYIAPRVERYLATLERELGELEVSTPAPRDAVERRHHERREARAASRFKRCSQDLSAARSAVRHSPWRPADATCSASTWAEPRSTSASSSTASRQSRPKPSSRDCPS